MNINERIKHLGMYVYESILSTGKLFLKIQAYTFAICATYIGFLLVNGLYDYILEWLKSL